MKKLPKTISEDEFLSNLKKVRKPKHKLAFMLGFYQCMRVSEIVGQGNKISNCCGTSIIRKRSDVISRKGYGFLEYFCVKCERKLKATDIRYDSNNYSIPPLRMENIDIGRGFIHLLNAKGGKDRDIPIMKPVERGLKHLPIIVTRQALHAATKYYFGHDVHFHTFRHSGATFYLNEKKIGIRQIQQLLGHSDIQTTQIYTHVTPDNLKDTFEEVW